MYLYDLKKKKKSDQRDDTKEKNEKEVLNRLKRIEDAYGNIIVTYYNKLKINLKLYQFKVLESLVAKFVYIMDTLL